LKNLQEIKASESNHWESWILRMFSLSALTCVGWKTIYLMTPNNKGLVPCGLTHPTPFLSIFTHVCEVKGYVWWHLTTRNLSLVLCVLTQGANPWDSSSLSSTLDSSSSFLYKFEVNQCWVVLDVWEKPPISVLKKI
jgi:hypothetical protein